MFERYGGSDASLLIRTDFSDDEAWAALCSAAQAPSPENGFCAYFDCVNDPSIANQKPCDIAKQVHADLRHTATYFADRDAIADLEFPVLCVDGSRANAPQFRVTAEQIWGPENNLRLSNMDFDDFVNAASENGIFRGF